MWPKPLQTICLYITHSLKAASTDLTMKTCYELVYVYIFTLQLFCCEPELKKKNQKLYTETTTKFKDTKKELWAKKENKFYI